MPADLAFALSQRVRASLRCYPSSPSSHIIYTTSYFILIPPLYTHIFILRLVRAAAESLHRRCRYQLMLHIPAGGPA